MNKYLLSIVLLCATIACISCNSVDNQLSQQIGPYTIVQVDKGVYHIMDCNDSNPAGVHYDSEGKSAGMNNISDMYMIVGKDRALWIDLSNFVQWDDSAIESIREIAYQIAGDRDIVITITHNHGDHLGMLPAFQNDTKVSFWVPRADFDPSRAPFPANRTTYFNLGEKIDLGGGMVVNTLLVQGHTAGSTLFFIEGKNMAFSGDALGSGSGVWIFNYDSFLSYIDGVENLISYIENPANGIDIDKFTLFGGHSWQIGNLGKLDAQYVYDMQTLIEQMGKGIAEYEPYSANRAFLNTNFKYGRATITWNDEAYFEYAASQGNPIQ